MSRTSGARAASKGTRRYRRSAGAAAWGDEGAPALARAAALNPRDAGRGTRPRRVGAGVAPRATPPRRVPTVTGAPRGPPRPAGKVGVTRGRNGRGG